MRELFKALSELEANLIEQHEGEIRHPNFIRLDSIKGILDKL